MYSPAISNLIKVLKKLPGVGEHTAERYVLHWLKSGKKEVAELGTALQELVAKVKSCPLCWNFSDSAPCPICADPKRDHRLICLVAEAPELAAIERSGGYRGLYHVLRGTLTTEPAEAFAKLKIKELLNRLKKTRPPVAEVILALSPDLAGETTMLYLEQTIKKIAPGVKTTRLARGLPLGSDLKYADNVTLENAIKHRVATG